MERYTRKFNFYGLVVEQKLLASILRLISEWDLLNQKVNANFMKGDIYYFLHFTKVGALDQNLW